MYFRILAWVVSILIVAVSACQTTSVSTTKAVQQGDISSNASDFDQAIEEYETFLKENARLGIYRNYERESEVCRKLAYVHSTQGLHSKSLSYLEQALELDNTKNKDKIMVVEDLRLIGITYSYLGNFTLAEKYLSKSLERSGGMEKSNKTEQKLRVADTHISLAHVALAMGNYAEALASTETALGTYKTIPGEDQGKAEAFLLMGTIHVARDQLLDGIEFITSSMSIARQSNLSIARQLQALGEAHRMKGDLENSLKFRLDALTEAENSKIKPQVIWSTLRVGDAYNELGNQEKAEELYQKALSLQTTGAQDTSALLPSIQLRMGDAQQASSFWDHSGSALGAGIAYLKLGNKYLNDGDNEGALNYLRKAEIKFEGLGSAEGLANVNLGISTGLNQLNRFDEALALIEKTRLQTEQSVTLWQLLFQQGIALEGINSNEEAIKAYLESIGIIEEMRGSLAIEEFRSSFFNNKTRVYDRLIRLLIESDDQLHYNGREVSSAELAFVYNEKARSRTFLDLLGNTRINPKTLTDEAMLEQEQATRIKIQQLSKQIQRNELNGQALRTVRDEMNETQEEYQQLLQEIKLRNSDYQTMVSVDPPSLVDIQGSLQTGTALLEYWIGEEAAVVWVIDNETVRHKLLPIEKSTLVREITGVRNSIKFKVGEKAEEYLRSLYDQLISPVSEWITPYERIGIIPHGPLHFLPFQALTSPENRYLIEDKNIFFSPSASVYYYTKERKSSTKQNILGMALGDHSLAGLSPLPGTNTEITQIGQFFDSPDMVSGEGNQESYFKSQAPDYEYIHLATHGILSQDQPLYSYLLMSPSETDDGRLTVHEIMDLNLNSSLITLSACETGLGSMDNGDELVGLSRAFLYAGTRGVIVSLWKVDDTSTAMLMTKFHQFLNEGSSPVEALGMAQRSMIESEFKTSNSRGDNLEWDTSIIRALENGNVYKEHPYYWAAFVLIGAD